MFRDSVKELLKLSRSGFELYDGIQKKLVNALRENKLIRERVTTPDEYPRSW